MNLGTKLGTYEIVESIGRGGMGEVFRAHDTKLERDVAIKVLPEAFAQDPERVARFEREAKLLAQLSHPGIATLHGIESFDGTLCLVMELVEGETFAERIARTPMSWEELQPLFVQMAEALEEAHEKGIVHRDLKPSNVMLTPEGRVKILDFGLAKTLVESTASDGTSQSPTFSRGTALGVILGTASYMSPEQARGKSVDKRTDIWAFGCCLYEALTGAKPFDGETVTDVLAAVVNREPDYRRLPALPRAGRALLERMLQKDARVRLRDIGEARVALAHDESFEVAAPRVGAAPLFLAGIGLGVAAASLVAWMLPEGTADLPLRRYRIPIARSDSYWQTVTAVLSPDGRRIAYVEGGRLWLRELDALEGREVPNTAGATSPFWSPGGDEVGYFDGAALELRAASVASGSSRRICEVLRFSAESTASWGVKGTIVFSSRDANPLVVSARGGEARALVPAEKVEKTEQFSYPQFLPDGETILGVQGRRAVAIRRDGPAPIPGLPDGIGFVTYSPTEHLLYQQGDHLWAVSFSTESMEVKGEPVPLSERGLFPTVASDGTLLYLSPGLVQLVWVDRNGRSADAIGRAQTSIQYPTLSPEGERIVAMGIENARTDLWVHDLSRGTSWPLTSDPARDLQPSWFPSGDEVVFGRIEVSIESGLVAIRTDGSGELRELTSWGVEAAVSPDGSRLAFVRIDRTNPKSPYDIFVLSLTHGGDPVPFLATSSAELLPSISPDGRFLAYMSDRTGRFEIYVASFPDGARTFGPISTAGGVQPRWSARGELFYLDESGLLAVPVTTDGVFSWRAPKRLFTEAEAGVLLVDRSQVPITRRYDVAPDGERFVMVREVSDAGGLVVVQNFTRALEPSLP